MELFTCPNYGSCAVTKGLIIKKPKINFYKETFCQACVAGFKHCLRFKVRSIIGTCPLEIMPDDINTPEEVIAGMKMDFENEKLSISR